MVKKHLTTKKSVDKYLQPYLDSQFSCTTERMGSRFWQTYQVNGKAVLLIEHVLTKYPQIYALI